MRHFICCFRGETTTIIYSEYVILASGIQHVMRMRRLSSVYGPTLQYFSTLSHKQHNFGTKKFVERKM
jgi:hypothetical protein